jgi:DNA-directed RNA polymerase subunit omega
MARVTIEDCIKMVPSRFELVVLAAQRAREIANGAEPIKQGVKEQDNKNAVIALREISENVLSLDCLREAVIEKYQKRRSVDNSENVAINNMHDDIEEELTSLYNAVHEISSKKKLFEDEESDDLLEDDSELDADLDTELDEQDPEMENDDERL